MKIFINPIINKNFNKSSNPTFEARGKALPLDYIVKERSALIPERVLLKAKEALANTRGSYPSLLEIHKNLYSQLLECKTLDEAKRIYPEFQGMIDKLEFKRKSVYSERFNKNCGEDFALKVLQEYWGNLKTKDEIAEQLGMKNRTSLEWALKQINFVGFPHNYKTLLNSSDTIGNSVIAAKTTAWNTLHPDLMYAHNRKAAQGCKTDEYRAAQSQRIKDYDKTNPERKEKISKSLKEGWQKCPEVRSAMSEFAAKENSYTRMAVVKKSKGQKLTQNEEKAILSFYKRFWNQHPELKNVYSEARKGCKGN